MNLDLRLKRGASFLTCEIIDLRTDYRLETYATIYCAPLERGDWAYRPSIDISLLWSENGLGNPTPTNAAPRFSSFIRPRVRCNRENRYSVD